MTVPPDLDRLRQIVATIARRHGVTTYEAVWQLGFELLDPLQNFDYHCTPTNSVAFAATGGDGIHLSILLGDPVPGGVVLTVPPGDIPNTVLADSFAEFLRLGYYGGFEWLEELGYGREKAQQQYMASVPGMSKVSHALLAEMKATFTLTPYADVRAHLDNLERRYAEHLSLPDLKEWERQHGV